jgi:hypothetical protein
MYEAKLAAFQELCAGLGARRCTVLYAEEDGKDVTAHASVSGIPSPYGPVSTAAKGHYEHETAESARVFAEYPRPTHPLTAITTGWLAGEPTWTSMQKLRLERGSEQFRAEFSYSDDMGIDAEVAAKISKVGIKIGGSFESFRKRKWMFDVAFWPRA